MISTGEWPPIFPVISFQLQPFSRLMSRIFSVRASRFIVLAVSGGRRALIPGISPARSDLLEPQ